MPLPFSELFSALETKAVDGQENPCNTILSSKFYEIQKYLTVTNHVYSPWIVLASKKWFDTRAEAAKALEDLKAKGMPVTVLSAAEADRMRDKLTRVNASIATNVGMTLWQETQAELAKLRAKK